MFPKSLKVALVEGNVKHCEYVNVCFVFCFYHKYSKEAQVVAPTNKFTPGVASGTAGCGPLT